MIAGVVDLKIVNVQQVGKAHSSALLHSAMHILKLFFVLEEKLLAHDLEPIAVPVPVHAHHSKSLVS